MGIERGWASVWREGCGGTSAKYTFADGVTACKWRSRKLSVLREGALGRWVASGWRNTLKKVKKKLANEGKSMTVEWSQS
jgi:hypothetical protein